MNFLVFDTCHTATWSFFHTFANVMYFLKCLEKSRSLRSPALALYLTRVWRTPLVHCKGYWVESLPCKFTKSQSHHRKKRITHLKQLLFKVFVCIFSSLTWLPISKSCITSWLHHL